MSERIIKQIEEIRKSNNRLWMNLLRIAMKRDPVNTKRTMAKITKNDRRISDLVQEMVDD